MSLILKKIKSNYENIYISGEKKYKGKISKFDGKIAECNGFPSSIGTICKIYCDENNYVTSEIIGFKDNKNLLAVHDLNANVVSGSNVEVLNSGNKIQVGFNLLGRVIDANGNFLDNNSTIPLLNENWPINGKFLNPMEKEEIVEPLDVGIKAINSLLTVGRGQRLGIVAGSGVGKSVLLGMMTKFTSADIVIVGLIGERSREVKSFVNHVFNSKTRKKTIIIAVPADKSPLLRIRGALRATSIAEYFREKGKNVLLIMDSLTRIAHAKREVGLAIGEQPTSKGYPPSVISMIPNLIERTGTGRKNSGSITAFYTILADSDDNNDPVVDTARAILDGHIVLSREHAQMGIYPAIDVNLSLSRVMNNIIDNKHQEKAKYIKKLYSLYLENRDLVLMGGYNKGQNEDLDKAVDNWSKICSLLIQSENQPTNFSDSLDELFKIS
tara:strand:- start:7511 stop:8833 length:1323 start_codon:yes stop_codon:yes gene_type:complete